MLPKGTISRVGKYYRSWRYEEEVKDALREFFALELPDAIVPDHPMAEGLFNEWYLYERRMKGGKTPLEDWIERNPFEIPAAGMELYVSLSKNIRGLFEIKTVKPLVGMVLIHLQTGKEHEVREMRATMDVEAGDTIYTRIAPVGDHLEMIGADSFVLPRFSAGLRKILKREKRPFTSKEAFELIRGDFE